MLMEKDLLAFGSFYREFGKALENHSTALFVGAGMSVAAGFKTWPNLLQDIAGDLGLSAQKETDLVSLAQFYVNKQQHVRATLNQLLVDEYNKDVTIPRNHEIMARLPIDTVWTTNYDTLLERAFLDAGKLVDVKVSAADFSTGVRGKDVTVYKMHGDISRPSEAVLIKEDYELYHVRHEVFTNALKG